MAVDLVKPISKIILDDSEIPVYDKYEVFDTSDTTTTPEDVLSGYDFYDKDGQLVSGTIETMAGGTFTSNQILNTKGKYLTDDIIVKVSGGDTREENDTMAKMKSIDFMMYEMRSISLSEIPFQEEYEEQQALINEIIDSSKFNVTNFINYVTVNCLDAMKKNLRFKEQTPVSYIPYIDSVFGQVSDIMGFGTKNKKQKTLPSNTTAEQDKVLLGRMFYNKDGDATYGSISSIFGREVDINQTLLTAGKYLEGDINIKVPVNGKNPNETFNEIVSFDNLLYNLRFIANQYTKEEDYLEQQEHINNLIYNIQGVKF